ncbi:MAG: zinc-ribbon domain-containing protein [Candidatus Bathyarchaeia archaeon]
MVYCIKCGAKNPDDAETCTQCGASLYPGKPPTRRAERRKHEEECFGIPRGGTVVGLAIGAIIVIWGLISLLQQPIFPDKPLISPEMSPWPIAIIIFGTLIVIGALYGLSRRY